MQRRAGITSRDGLLPQIDPPSPSPRPHFKATSSLSPRLTPSPSQEKKVTNRKKLGKLRSKTRKVGNGVPRAAQPSNASPSPDEPNEKPLRRTKRITTDHPHEPPTLTARPPSSPGQTRFFELDLSPIIEDTQPLTLAPSAVIKGEREWKNPPKTVDGSPRSCSSVGQVLVFTPPSHEAQRSGPGTCNFLDGDTSDSVAPFLHPRSLLSDLSKDSRAAADDNDDEGGIPAVILTFPTPELSQPSPLLADVQETRGIQHMSGIGGLGIVVEELGVLEPPFDGRLDEESVAPKAGVRVSMQSFALRTRAALFRRSFDDPGSTSRARRSWETLSRLGRSAFSALGLRSGTTGTTAAIGQEDAYDMGRRLGLDLSFGSARRRWFGSLTPTAPNLEATCDRQSYLDEALDLGKST
ncbi:hypothetical protein DXG03_001509 [Asterophora parasitica]|uniref:Uncharacterized protein n=1 Tax=Asterophora parasitica TaxID=117018 RepID=A0A9P7G9I7_9AGAR|nr:hypothetical protein DXG03_001509 [Asterophora parasitica]